MRALVRSASNIVTSTYLLICLYRAYECLKEKLPNKNINSKKQIIDQVEKNVNNCF